jgi:hypothetical protein
MRAYGIFSPEMPMRELIDFSSKYFMVVNKRSVHATSSTSAALEVELTGVVGSGRISSNTTCSTIDLVEAQFNRRQHTNLD